MAMGDDDSNENRNRCNGVDKQLLSMAIVAAGHSGYTGIKCYVRAVKLNWISFSFTTRSFVFVSISGCY